MTDIFKQIKSGFILIILLSVLTGIIYPLVITGIAQLLFSWEANGSLIRQYGKTVGSALIGQSFTNPKYFWGRPSATTQFPYNGNSSSGSNLGPSNPNLLVLIKIRVKNLQNNLGSIPVPVDLVTASGSGLDPEISPLAAYYQVPRIAQARGISEEQVHSLIHQHIKDRLLGILGEPRVNVLQLNLSLDKR